METHKLLAWFERRRKVKSLDLAQRQIEKSIDTVAGLERVITAFSEGRKEDIENNIKRLFLDEAEIDELRESVFETLTEGTLPNNYREDLKGLVEHLDRMADHVKDAARSLKILSDTNTIVPKEILELFVITTRTLVKCASALRETIEMLDAEPSQVKALVAGVESIENNIDDEYLRLKKLFVIYAGQINAGVLIVFNDFTECMECIADLCADTGDHLRVLAASEEKTQS